ncbi:BURP domain-containing protein [Dioscorea alata]|uniref:BURP domain-containing protein n=1 Tax=Dioscorea alata TaxID=55571 RepID=A0ACB7WCL1_DIOAL|nr:BURP domain-containing protein [Dioscorea alata]
MRSYTRMQGKSKAYMMALEENDGMKVEAIAVRHLDTSKWNPKLLVLKRKPESMPIYYFIIEDHVLYNVRK